MFPLSLILSIPSQCIMFYAWVYSSLCFSSIYDIMPVLAVSTAVFYVFWHPIQPLYIGTLNTAMLHFHRHAYMVFFLALTQSTAYNKNN